MSSKRIIHSVSAMKIQQEQQNILAEVIKIGIIKKDEILAAFEGQAIYQ